MDGGEGEGGGGGTSRGSSLLGDLSALGKKLASVAKQRRIW